MAGEAAQIKTLLKTIVNDGKDDSQWVIPCTIKSIDGILAVCSPINGEADIVDVKLCSESDDTNFIILPSIGSVVHVSMMDECTGIITMFSKIDSIKIRGDQYSGLVKVEELVTKINALENLLNGFITIYNTHTHAVSGAATAVPNQTETQSINPITNKSDLENPNVKHG